MDWRGLEWTQFQHVFSTLIKEGPHPHSSFFLLLILSPHSGGEYQHRVLNRITREGAAVLDLPEWYKQQLEAGDMPSPFVGMDQWPKAPASAKAKVEKTPESTNNDPRNSRIPDADRTGGVQMKPSKAITVASFLFKIR